MTGCQSSGGGGSSNTMSDLDAQAYSQTGTNLTQDITGAIIDWAESGSITGMSVSGAVAGSSLQTATVTDEGDGWVHLVDTQVSTAGSFSADLHIKLVKNASDEVIEVLVYGTYALNMSYAGNSYIYAMSYGNSKLDPYHGTITRAGADIIQVDIEGLSSFAVDITTLTSTVSVSMTYDYSDFSLPITSGPDYPTGTISITNVVRNGVAQSDITITFNGTNTATMNFGTFTTTFTFDPA